MSLAYDSLNAVAVYDPRVVVANKRDYACLKGGSQVLYKQWTSTSINQSQINFSCPAPSGGIFVDRKIYLYLPMRLTFTGIPAMGDTLIVPTKDAPRAFPISGSLINLQSTINNQSVSINLADMVHTLQHFNSDVKSKNGVYSGTPNYFDQSQQYGDLAGTVRNPLSCFDNGTEEAVMQRGAFPFTIVQNDPSPNGTDVMTAIIDYYPMEPLFLPPYYFGQGNGSALFNVTSMDFVFTFLNNMWARVWSHMTGVAGTVPFLSGSCVFGSAPNGPASYAIGGNQPILNIQYITPQEVQILSPNMSISYPYFDLQAYPTQLATILAPVPPVFAVPASGSSNNIQLNSIPRRVYIYVRENNQTLFNDASLTDSFLPINNISIQFMAKNGLMASASPLQLYQMSVKNGLNMSWAQWSGQATLKDGSRLATSGGPVCLEFGTDIGLDSLDCAGKLGQYMFQCTVSYVNTSNRQMSPTLYIVPVLEGCFTVPCLGRALINIGVITSQDILESHTKDGLNYQDVQDVNGGNFWSGIKHTFAKIHDFIKKHQLVSRGLSHIPHPVGQVASRFAKHYGYGDGHCDGMPRIEQIEHEHENGEGVHVGGKKMTHAQLQKRLKHY